MTRAATWLRRVPGPVALLAVAAPVLLFPQLFPRAVVWMAAGLGALSQVGGGFLGSRTVRTPADLALAVFCLTALAGTALSPVPSDTLPKATGLLFGVASMRLVASLAVTPATVWRLGWVYVALGLPVTAVGLLSTAWNTKIGAIGSLTANLPMANLLPGRVRVNANALAAAVLTFLPLLTMLCLWAWRRSGGAPLRDRPRLEAGAPAPKLSGRLAAAAAAMAWVATLATLVLTQSRTGWVSAGVTLGALAAVVWLRSMRTTRARLLAGAAIVALPMCVWALVFGFTLVPDQTPSSLDAFSSSTVLSLEARRAVWANAVWAVRDFPVTGVGLGAFRRVVETFYPLYLELQDVETVHAHNQVLQVALDVGLPGLVAYLALILVCAASCVRVFWHGDARLSALGLGLAGNLLAMHIFGLTDAIALGAKLGWFFWLTLGLALAADRAVRRARPGRIEEPA